MTEADLKEINVSNYSSTKYIIFLGGREREHKNPNSSLALSESKVKSETVRLWFVNLFSATGQELVYLYIEFLLNMHWTLPRAWKRSISLVKQSMSIWSCLLQLLNCCISSSWKIIPCEKDLHWILVSLVRKGWVWQGKVRTEEQVWIKSF